MFRHHLPTWMSLLVLISTTVAQQPVQQPAPQPVNDAKKAQMLDDALTRWEKAMASITSFESVVTRVEHDKAFGSKEEYSGVVKYMAPNLALMDLKKKDKPNEYEKWVCSGTYVYQYIPQSKKINVIEMPKPKQGQVTDEGIFSLMCSIKADEAKKRYGLDYVKGDDWYHYIEIRPRTPEDKAEFSVARLVLNKDTFLPREIRFLAPNGNEVLWDISPKDLQLNKKMERKEFEKPDVPSGWQLEMNPRVVRQQQPEPVPQRK